MTENFHAEHANSIDALLEQANILHNHIRAYTKVANYIRNIDTVSDSIFLNNEDPRRVEATIVFQKPYHYEQELTAALAKYQMPTELKKEGNSWRAKNDDISLRLIGCYAVGDAPQRPENVGEEDVPF